MAALRADAVSAAQPVRSFVAIELLADIRKNLALLLRRLREGNERVAWVKPENLHATVFFLGDASRDELERFSAALRDGIGEVAPFRVRIAGLKVVPSRSRPRTLWADMEGPSDAFACLKRTVDTCARTIDRDPEDRPFRPHVTLARFRGRGHEKALISRVEDSRDFDAGEFTIRGVSLFASRLTPNGSIYTRLEEFTF